MKLKTFSIISSIFIGVIIILSIVLVCVKTTTAFTCSAPSTINVYNHKTVSTSYTKTDTPVNYEKLWAEIKNIGKLSVLDRIVNKYEIDDKISQDIQGKNGKWDSEADTNNKKENIVIELEFEEKQSQIIYVDGDSKLIEYKKLIFVAPEDGKSRELVVYFMISDGSAYSTNPFLIHGNCKNLIKVINNL